LSYRNKVVREFVAATQERCEASNLSVVDTPAASRPSAGGGFPASQDRRPSPSSEAGEAAAEAAEETRAGNEDDDEAALEEAMDAMLDAQLAGAGGAFHDDFDACSAEDALSVGEGGGGLEYGELLEDREDDGYEGPDKRPLPLTQAAPPPKRLKA
jgi:hypothetical protein